MAILSEKMIAALYEKAKASNADFPVRSTLNIGEETIIGYLYADGTFTEGETPIVAS